MIAVQGIYENGKLLLSEAAPMSKARVIVIFPSDESVQVKTNKIDTRRKLFDEFSGSIQRNIDLKSERLGALDEKYTSID